MRKQSIKPKLDALFLIVLTKLGFSCGIPLSVGYAAPLRGNDD